MLRTARPVFNVRLVRELAPELREIAALLRLDTSSARGIVLSERLLTNGASPLYGAEIDDLNHELRRIRHSGATGPLSQHRPVADRDACAGSR
jgi:hypothetical protein